MSYGIQVGESLGAGAVQAARRAAENLLSRQSPEGYWWGDLTADTTLESDFILLQLWLHPPRQGVWDPPARPLVDRAARSILERQLPGGGFNTHPKGPADISASVKAYFSLKLAGLPSDGPELSRLRECILSLGGIQAANSYVKLNLSFFGLYPRERCPSIPPEMVLLPGNFIYQMSSWTRAIVIPLSIVHSGNPRRPVPAGFDLRELFLSGASLDFEGGPVLSWRNAFLWLDRAVKLWEKYGSTRLRRKAVREAERWILERTRRSDGLAAIYPPMMYAIMAFDVRGYPADHPDRVEAQRQFDRLLVDDGNRFFFQPCFSPVWDTAIAAFSLGEADANPAGPLRIAADWMLSKEVRSKGDWSVKRPATEPSGWYFEMANEFYPDIDDTAMVLLALEHAQASDPQRQMRAERRAVDWLLGMQSSDGGWAAFDVDNNWHLLNKVPFADHNAMLDPTCPDITGRVLDALCRRGLSHDHPSVSRGVDYLISHQKEDGSWYGRWGVNYVYGTFLALRGLRASGSPDVQPAVRKASAWLRSAQNPDGGWGESCAGYEKHHFVRAVSTPSQTAWAVLGLVAAGEAGSSAARRGVEWLVARRKPDGTWDEELTTGTGFPNVFYLTYHMYRHYFPLLALSTWQASG